MRGPQFFPPPFFFSFFLRRGQRKVEMDDEMSSGANGPTQSSVVCPFSLLFLSPLLPRFTVMRGGEPPKDCFLSGGEGRVMDSSMELPSSSFLSLPLFFCEGVRGRRNA